MARRANILRVASRVITLKKQEEITRHARQYAQRVNRDWDPEEIAYEAYRAGREAGQWSEQQAVLEKELIIRAGDKQRLQLRKQIERIKQKSKMKKLNVYTCSCGHKTVTVDLVEGTTPMHIRCRQKEDGANRDCTNMATSAFYRCDPSLEPEYEWYKPSDLKKLNPQEREHVKMGGLLLRKIKKEA